MRIKPLVVFPFLVFASYCSAFVVSVDTSSTVEFGPFGLFFDDSVEVGTTTYSAHASFDSSTMLLKEYVDDSGVDDFGEAYTLWNWYFSMDGVFQSMFGNYAFSSSTSNLIVQVGHYAWNLPDEYDVFVAIETFVAPENPESALRYFSTTPFTRDGVTFTELWDEAPKVYFGGNIGFSNAISFADPSLIDEALLKDGLWDSFGGVSDSGSFTMFAGSYAENEVAYGVVGGNAGPYNNGTFEYDVSKNTVPDSGSAFSMLGLALFVLVGLRRKF